MPTISVPRRLRPCRRVERSAARITSRLPSSSAVASAKNRTSVARDSSPRVKYEATAANAVTMTMPWSSAESSSESRAVRAER